MVRPRPLRSVVSLFSGAGGFDVGLERAGFRSVFATDVAPEAIATLRDAKARQIRVGPGRTHLADTAIVEADVRELSGSKIEVVSDLGDARPDVLVGGPPCQPFSSCGRRRALGDPRGTLFLEFVRLARELRPRMLLFENVRGLLTASARDGRPGGVLRLIQSSFESLGYATRFAMLNSADYGVPQRRVRLYMMAAIDVPLPEFPPPTHSRTGELWRAPWPPLGDFLRTLPPPEEGDVVRPAHSRLRELSELIPGTGLRAPGIVEANRPGGHWGYRQDSFLADPRLPARTIRAASTPDWIRLRRGGIRRLTWRECAALQGFPWEWPFAGRAATRFRLIGNAVQTTMAEVIGRSMLSALDESRTKPVSAPWPAEFVRRIRYTESEARVNGDSRKVRRPTGS